MIHLVADMTFSESQLRADYRIQNVFDGRQVLVFTKLFRPLPSGQKVIDPLLAYVSTDAEDGLMIEKVVPDIPVGMEVDEPELPFAELLQPGQSMTGGALVLWPPHYYTPYSGDGAVLPVPKIQRASIRIGFVVIDGDASFWRQASGQASGNFIVEYDMAFAMQRFVVSKSFCLS